MIDPEPEAPPAVRKTTAQAAEVRALFKSVVRLRAIAGAASVVAFLALLGLFLTYQRFSTLRPIVEVGGQSITKRDYESALEEKDGGRTLHDLVSSVLIRQAADKVGVLPSDSDVDTRLAEIRQRDPGQVQAAESDGSLPLLRDQLLAQIALENLRIQGVTVSDAEVSRYYNAHRADFKQSAQAKMTLVVADTAVEAAGAAADLHDGIAESVIAEQNGLHVAGQDGYAVDLGTSQGRALAASWKTMHVGEIRTASLGSQFLVALLVSAQQPRIIPLQDIKAGIVRLARLEKAVPAQVELDRLYKADPPTFPVEKYAQYFGK
ncbi:MAG: peptidyl-prolyl cis-trans isomerase [Janthinobacterium lividum]